jgi:GNAT superfamily N-acetyltransferase
MLERTTDAELVRRILDPVKPEICEGDAEPGVVIHESIFYLVAKRAGEPIGVVALPIGVVAFLPRTAVAWEAHEAILREHRGSGTAVMRAAVEWMFQSTACRKVVCEPPAFKVAMVRVLEKCGFRYEGLSPKSFLWRGALHDRVLMGIEKESLE